MFCNFNLTFSFVLAFFLLSIVFSQTLSSVVTSFEVVNNINFIPKSEFGCDYHSFGSNLILCFDSLINNQIFKFNTSSQLFINYTLNENNNTNLSFPYIEIINNILYTKKKVYNWR